MVIIVHGNTQKIEFRVHEYACMLVLRNPKHHIFLYGNKSPSGTVWLVCTNSSLAQRLTSHQTNCMQAGRESVTGHHRGDEFHVIRRGRTGRDGDVEASLWEAAS